MIDGAHDVSDFFPGTRSAPGAERSLGSHTSEVEINLGAVARNVARLVPRSAVALAMVKDDAYNHGAIPIAYAALAAGATWLGVATVPEGERLRAAGISAPILVTTEPGPGLTERAIRSGLTCAVYTSAGIDRIAAAAAAAHRSVDVHLKVNTGLNRVGAEPADVVRLAAQIVKSGLRFHGLWTHFVKSEEPDDPLTGVQLKTLLAVCEDLGTQGMSPMMVHCANTAAILTAPETHLDMVRMGIGIYGYTPADSLPGAEVLEPVLSWTSSVSMVRRIHSDTRVGYGHTRQVSAGSLLATVPVGFGDGYRRALSNQSHVIIRGRRYPVAGVVAMGQMVVDCGEDEIAIGDQVVLIGTQGNETVSAGELAHLAGTVVDEIFSGISARVPRVYTSD